jgi:ADP-heptose:LPS heptosyltransferase
MTRLRASADAILALTKGRPRGDDSSILRLRPEYGFGDHLMLAAVIEGVKAEHPELRVRVAADHPEIFWHNPNVEHVIGVHRLRKRYPDEYARYREVERRPPAARYMQVSGHLLDDMYDSVGVPLRSRPHMPRIYLTWLERRYGRTAQRLPRPRIAVAPHGTVDVKLPNKVYPPDQWLALGQRLVAEYGSVLHVGSSAEGPLLPGAVDFRDLGYRRTASVLKRCDLLVTHVGGIMHLGTAVGVPTVVLYGAAEHPAISGYPWNRNLYTPIECGPCWLQEPCSHHSCMRRLTPDVVLEEVRTALLHGAGGTRDVLAPS